jgi:hypothetical protein
VTASAAAVPHSRPPLTLFSFIDYADSQLRSEQTLLEYHAVNILSPSADCSSSLVPSNPRCSKQRTYMEGELHLHEMPATAEAPILEIAPVD